MDGTKYPATQAGLNSALRQINAMGGGHLVIPPNTTIQVSSTIDIPTNTNFECSDLTSVLRWTGSSSGTMLSLRGNYNTRITKCTLTTSAGGTSVGILAAAATNLYIGDLYISGGSSTTGFGTGIHLTGDSRTRTQSNVVTIHGINMTNYLVAGLYVDHTGNLLLDGDDAFALQTGGTATDIVFDAGTNGVLIQSIQTFRGATGVVIKFSGSGSPGTYDAPPWSFNADQFVVDSVQTNDAILFDSSLGANEVDFRCTNCWMASARKNGIHISGGQKIKFQGGRTRLNGLNGVLIDGPTVKDVLIDSEDVTANNIYNSADAHGINVTAGIGNFRFVDNRIGNTSDVFGTGHQFYGVRIGSILAAPIEVIGNDLSNNGVGPFSCGATSTGIRDHLFLANTQSNGIVQEFTNCRSRTINTVPGANGGIRVYDPTGTNILFTTSATGIANAIGLENFNVTLGSSSPGCATLASVGATCTTSQLSLPFTQSDSSYHVTCTGKGPTGVPVVINTTNSSASAFTITIAALTGFAASFASADCIVGHN